MLIIENEAYRAEVEAFARRIGKYEGDGVEHGLKAGLDYLDTYAVGKCRCTLYPDRPMGFGFLMEREVSPGEWRTWFNGGLLYHGPVDGYGSGAGPVFAVTVSPVNGWSIHT